MVTWFYRVQNLMGPDDNPDTAGATLSSLMQPYMSGTPGSGIFPLDIRGRGLPRANKTVGAILLFRDTPQNMKRIREVVALIDQPSPQVMITVRVVELARTDNFEFGFESAYAQNQETFFRGFTGVYNPVSFLQSQGSPTPFQGTRLNFSTAGTSSQEDIGLASVVIRALERTGRGRIVSRPQIMVREGKTATLSATTDVPYQQYQGSGTQLTYLNTRFKKIGTELTITPRQIGADQISLAIFAKVEEIVRFAEGGGGVSNPVIASRQVTTQVTLRDQQELILGGLRSSDRLLQTNRVPLLADIPLFGELFKSSRRTTQTTEVFFFITPRIISGSDWDETIVIPEATATELSGESGPMRPSEDD
jgi:type IV pilus assembly protein PilQ